jgi:hypothetical protein
MILTQRSFVRFFSSLIICLTLFLHQSIANQEAIRENDVAEPKINVPTFDQLVAATATDVNDEKWLQWSCKLNVYFLHRVFTNHPKNIFIK